MADAGYDSRKKGLGHEIKELFEYGDLFLILAYRDLRVRYAQTFLGIFWAFLQPAATLLIFILIFGKAVKVDTGNVPYPLFALTGMAAWAYFSFVLSQSGQSIIGAQEMIKKIYFPRLVIPLSKAVVAFVDFFIAIIFVIILMILYQYSFTINILWFPVFFLINIIAALSIGIWLSALTIRYRDFIHVIPFLVQFGLYATPVGYPASLIPQKYQLIYHLNPMAGVVEGFRYSILGVGEISIFSYISFMTIGLLFVSGIIYFKKVEKVMADIL
ncbi:MAG: ABC transporter permease [Cyclobacteriaceae bacterium]|nr:ABC transporter permease [Cyclobacteriaceae bacterium]